DAGVSQVHAEARPEERLFDIVCGQRIAGEELVDISTADQLAKRWAATRVYDRWSADDERLAAAAPISNQVAGDLPHERALRLLGRYTARHKCEVAAYSGPLDWNDAHTAVAD